MKNNLNKTWWSFEKQLCGEWKSSGAGTQRHDKRNKVKKLFLSGEIKGGCEVSQWSDITSQIHLAAFSCDNSNNNNNVLLRGALTPAAPASADQSSELSLQQTPQNSILAWFAIMKFCFMNGFNLFVQWSWQRYPVEGRATSSNSYWNSGSSIETQRIFSPHTEKNKNQQTISNTVRLDDFPATDQINQPPQVQTATCQVYLWTLPLVQTALNPNICET